MGVVFGWTVRGLRRTYRYLFENRDFRSESEPSKVGAEQGPAALAPEADAEQGFGALHPQANAPSNEDRFEDIWLHVQRDLTEFQNIAHTITPNIHLHYKLRQAVSAPGVNRSQTLTRLIDRIPLGARHMIALPLLGTAGGSEKVSLNLIRALRAHYQEREVLVFAPDAIFNLSERDYSRYQVPIVSINEIDAELSVEDRVDLFDRILIESQLKTVHTVNSDIAWLAFVDRAKHYRQDTELFGSAYSDIRVDTMPVGAFWRYVPQTIDHLSGIIVDNGSVVRKAADHFNLAASQREKFHILHTPIEPIAHQHEGGGKGALIARSLWLSRIALEKRIDVLAEIARRSPQREFVMYGSAIKGAFPVDLSWIDDLNNVKLRGEFERLQDIPFEEFDSFVFTTSAEGLPIVLLEMAMIGLPIIAPDVGGIGELINDSTGWLVSSPDAIDEYVEALEAIRNNPGEVAKRTRAARNFVLQRHSWENFTRSVRVIPNYIQCAEQALEKVRP